ncbi:MAG TPA: peptidase M50 [Firmicutes bacterium]|nr:peptidase M50 [Bacillota bacterium]
MLLADRSGIGIAGAAAAILHELGHLLCMKWLGVPAVRIKCGIFGLEILEEKRACKGYLADVCIALAGPCANAAAFFLLLPIQWLFPSELVSRLLGVNAVLAAFHLLPVEPLDGGQALYAALCRRLPVSTAERLTSAISFLTLLPLGILGFLVLLRSHYNFTLLLVSGYLMLMMLLKRGRYY